MDSIELTKEQESAVIEFIKRWGVDSPELVAEMLDHYCELVKEEMSHGREFQAVVNAWKTRETYFKLRKIEESYSIRLKKSWRRELKTVLKNVLLGKPILVFIVLYFLFEFAFAHELSSTILIWVFFIRTALITVLYSYFYYFKKKKRRIYDFKRLNSYGIFNGLVLIQVVPKFLGEATLMKYLNSDNLYFTAGLFTLVVAVDYVYYQLYGRAKLNSSHLTDEILAEFEVPPRA